MATETIILRPTGGSSNPNVLLYPDTFDIWNLVNEEVADDDATYFFPSKIDDARLRFTFPEKYKILIPSSIKIYSRAKKSNDTDVNVSFYIKNGGSGANQIGDSQYLSSIYQDYVVDISPDILEEVYSRLISDDESINYITFVYSSSGKNGEAAQITQVYLELTYEVEGEESESIFIRQNNSWVEISGTIYKKQNGVWELADSSVLQNGNHFILDTST